LSLRRVVESDDECNGYQRQSFIEEDDVQESMMRVSTREASNFMLTIMNPAEESRGSAQGKAM
jgi:hypothetical protein